MLRVWQLLVIMQNKVLFCLLQVVLKCEIHWLHGNSLLNLKYGHLQRTETSDFVANFYISVLNGEDSSEALLY